MPGLQRKLNTNGLATTPVLFLLYIRFDSENGNRIDLPALQFRAATHDLDIARVAEQAVAFLGGELLDDAATSQNL